MNGKIIPRELKELILDQIQRGQLSVSKAAVENNISAKTIYGWFRTKQESGSTISSDNLVLENARLKREKQELIELIGRLTVNLDRSSRSKKKSD